MIQDEKTLMYTILITAIVSFMAAGLASAEGIWTPYLVHKVNTDKIYSLAIEDNFIWCGTYGGVVRWNKQNRTYIVITSSDGLAGYIITSVAIDKNGTKWFGSKGCQITTFDDYNWMQYTPTTINVLQQIKNSYNEFSFGQIGSIVFDNDIVYVAFQGDFVRYRDARRDYGSVDCLVSYDGSSWKKELVSEFIYPSLRFVISVDKKYRNALWYSNQYGLNNFLFPNEFIRIPTGILFITVDNTGVVWVGGNSVITSYDVETTSNYGKESHGLDGWFWAGVVDKNNVKWFGSNNGVTRFDGTTWRTFAPEGWKNLGDEGDQVYSLAFDADSVLWAGTTKGLYKFEMTPVSVINSETVPSSILLSVFPNPFNNSTTLSFTLPSPGSTNLSTYSASGQKIRTLVSGEMSAGTHSVLWNSRDDNDHPVSSGVYLYRLEAGGKAATGKMLLMR